MNYVEALNRLSELMKKPNEITIVELVPYSGTKDYKDVKFVY